MDKRIYISALYDYYGSLLTEKQRKIFELYYFSDLSLNEIADKFSITKQAVRDSIVKSETLLSDYESKLNLFDKYNKRLKLIENVLANLKSFPDFNSKTKIEKILFDLKNID